MPRCTVSQKDKIKKVILPVHGLGLCPRSMDLWPSMPRISIPSAGWCTTSTPRHRVWGARLITLAGSPLGRKKAFAESGAVRIEVIRGKVVQGRPEAQYQVDGLSGATITSRGVRDMLRYWLGAEAFGPYLAKLKKRGVS